MLYDSNNYSDEQLIIEAGKGDQQALELLVKRYLSLVYGVSRRYLRDSDEAEDAVQEVFVKVWRNLKKFDTPSFAKATEGKVKKSARPWIMEITKNTCLDLIKKKRSIPLSVFDAPDGTNLLTENLTSKDPSPSEMVEQSQLKQLLNSAQKKLSKQAQTVLSLYYQQGLNFREIAWSLNESLNTVKSRHRRALISLKDLLKEY